MKKEINLKDKSVTYMTGAMDTLCRTCKWKNICKNKKEGTENQGYKMVVACKTYEMEI